MPAQLKSALLSYGRIFAGAALAAYVALGKTPFDLGVDDVKVVASAGVSALVIVLLNALNPADTRYGTNAG